MREAPKGGGGTDGGALANNSGGGGGIRGNAAIITGCRCYC